MTGPDAGRGRWLRALGASLVRAVLALLMLFAAGVAAVHVHDAAGVAVLAGAAAVQALVRPFARMAAVTAAAFLAALGAFAAIRPSNDRDWQPDVSRPPRVEIAGDLATVRDLRDFAWTEAETAEPRWTDRTYDLSRLDSLWLTLSYWDGNTAICHTVLSFGFAGGEHLAVSVETRKEVGETYSAWRGFFKQYELFYVLAEERDVLGVRAAHRGEDLHLYRLASPPERRRALLEDILRTAGALATRPDWYGALRQNCTTTLQRHVDHALGRAPRLRWDTVLNGSIDEKAWAAGAIADPRPFAEVRAAHRITDAARDAVAAGADAEEFSRAVRVAIR